MLEANSEHSDKIRQRINYQTSKSARLGDISAISSESLPDPIDLLKDSENPTLTELTDALVYWCQKTYGNDTFIEAHKIFQENSGTIFSEDDFYHERMGYFLDYFVFDKNISDDQEKPKTPFDNFLKSSYITNSELPTKTIKVFEELETYTHSIFLVLKSNSKKLLIRDLLTNQKIEIQGQGRKFFEQFSKPVIFQGFVFSFSNSNHLSKGLILHDREANKYIQRNLKKAKRSENFQKLSELFRFGKQNISFIRLKNITAKAAYQPK